MSAAWRYAPRAEPAPDREHDTRFLERLRADVQQNRLVLPSLPEVARRVREAVEDPRARSDRVAQVIGTDAAMSARLLKVANSPLYRRAGTPIEDLRTAVTRLGLPLVRTLIVNLSIVQVMRPHGGNMGARLNALFRHSVAVAAWSYALALRHARLSPQEALLAGMVHDIGYLPILQYAAAGKLSADPRALAALLRRQHTAVGTLVLESWGFGEGLKDVVRQHENVYRSGRGDADLVDVVIAAELFAGHEDEAARPPVDRRRVPALARLGLHGDEPLEGDPALQSVIAHANRLLRV